MNPYYMGIALNLVNQQVVFLGFRQTTAEIDALAAERAPGLPWTCIAMVQPAKKLGEEIEDWLRERLDPLTAKRLLKDLAVALAAKMEG